MSFDGVPTMMRDPIEWLRRTSKVVNALLQGKTNNVGTVTLNANSTTTTVTLSEGRLGSDTYVGLTPTTSSAKTAMADGYMITKDVAAQTFTITHNNTADTDKIFTFVLIG
jgi:alpha-glucuronidase